MRVLTFLLLMMLAIVSCTSEQTEESGNGSGSDIVTVKGPCEGISCSDHGECKVDKNNELFCDCEEGYYEDNLECIFSGEKCDGKDNNKDGQIDENLMRSCDNICGIGQEECITGAWGSCSAPIDGEVLVCENSNEFGTCTGFQSCDIGNGLSECTADTPEKEICDYKDNNCNDLVDEGVSNHCGTCEDDCYEDELVTVENIEENENIVDIAKNHEDNPRDKDGLTVTKEIKIAPYLWTANHNVGSVSKFNTNTNIEEGKYWVASNPSRTTVDFDGNMWVGGRNDGRVTKIIWDKDNCLDKNGNGKIDTSYIDENGTVVQINSAANPYADECVVFSEVVNTNQRSIRGIAPGIDNKIWVGYSSGGGGLQPIDVYTFEVGQYYPPTNAPLYTPDANGVYQDSGQKVNANLTYGLVVDSDGHLYMSSYDRTLLGRFDTMTRKWVAAYKKGGCSYGVTLGGRGKVWLGGHPNCAGALLFDPETNKITTFAFPPGTQLTPKNTSPALIIPNGGQGGQGGYSVTGVAVEPSTGDVWASIYQHNYTARLKVDWDNFENSTWTYIATTRDANNNNLPGIGSGLWGIGFDHKGYAWTLGAGSKRVWKIDPATNERDASLPEGKDVGNDTHYTYSDFTGATAFNYTAPSGTLVFIIKRPFNNAIPISVDWEAHAPNDTKMSTRVVAINADKVETSHWIPKEENTLAQYFDYPTGAETNHIDLKEHGEITDEFLKVEVKFSTKDRDLRPILYSYKVKWDLKEIR